ncbi:MAG: hypothetical protein WC797_03030 [Candidatus Paceibacterota bacterium]|jgi:ABC-type transport system involved in cytochrome c biogenesis permease component
MLLWLFNKRGFGKIVVILTTISFLWLVSFGLFHHMAQMRPDHTMGGCLLNGQVELCTMNFSEHIALWQSLLISLPEEGGLLSVILLIVILVVAIAARWYFDSEIFEDYTSRRSIFKRQYFRTNLYDPLNEAFSQGILNPKIYELVTI